MSFTNPFLLGGIAAFSIPLIIHLLNKRRFKVVEWGAMHLLAPIIKKNHRRIELEQLLLLLLRIGIPILLALCLAQPVLTKLRTYHENDKLSTVFLLDNSFSMQDGSSAQSNYARAKGEIGQALKEMRKGSDASVVLMGGAPLPMTDEPSTALDNVTKKLKAEERVADPADVAESLQHGVSELERMVHPGREIVLVSDFQKSDWQDADAVTRRSALEKLLEMPVRPNVTLYQIADGPRENACLHSIDVSALILGAGQPVSIRANLKNYGDTSYPDLMVYFKVDGVEKRSSQLTLGPRQDAQVLFTVAFETPGDHSVEISMDADALKADNSFVASFPVWESVPVLLVNGDPGSNFTGETDFLEIALQPFGAAGAKDLSDLVVSKTIEPNQLREDTLKGQRVVVLANVEKLDNGQVEHLEKYVRDGGGLIIFPGDRINAKWYNEDFFRKGEGLLPRQFTAFSGKGYGGGEGATQESAHIVSEVYTHPAFAFFNDSRNGKLSEPEFTTWLRIGLLGVEGSEGAAATSKGLLELAKLDSGDPFAVDRQVGEGRVIQCAVPADADWGNLPTQPAYLPMMQRMVTYLAASVDPPRNLASGDKLVAFLPVEMEGQESVLKDPAGVDHVIKVKKEGARGTVTYNDTVAPGLYTLTAPDKTTRVFAVNLSREESDIAVLSETEMRALADEMEASYVRNHTEFRALDEARRSGIGIWKPILFGLLLLLFGEILYQQWIARRTL